METTIKNSILERNYIAKSDRVESDVLGSLENQQVNILLVDDRPENLLAVRAVLEATGYNLVSANSGEEALRFLLKEDFAVILLDVQMPGLNGFETAKLIKQREKTKHIPIIFVTALSQATEHVLQGYTVGAIDYIFKPFHPETLRLKVEAFASIYRNQQQIKLQSELLRQEIQERNRIAEELSRSNKQIISIAESITDAFFTLDKNWCFTYLNRETKRILGINKKEIIGQPLWDVKSIINIKTPSKEEVNQKFYLAVELQRPQCFEIESQQGKWYGIRVYPSEAGVSVYFSNITECKQMVKDLQLSEERFRKIVQSSPSLISIRSTMNGCYYDVNASWVAHAGYSRAEALDKEFTGISFKGVSAEQKSVQTLNLLEPIQNARVSYITKSGVIREGLLSTEYIEIQGEKYILTVVTDITERVRLEKEMTRLDRMNLIGEMAAGIAHEVRNPMTTVCGFLQLAKEKKEVITSEYLDLMVEELNRANNIIKEFLALAKNKTTDKKPKKVNEIIQALIPLLQADALLADKSIDLELAECPELELDEKEIRQLILNLVKNGLEEMAPGKKLTIRTYSTEQEVIVEIQDQGSGIIEEFLGKIGNPFFTTKEWGTGLGLAVCYSIVERHNAILDFKTSTEGTIFFIRFELKVKV